MAKKKELSRTDGRYEIKKTIPNKVDKNGKPFRKSFYSYISKSDCERQYEQYIIEQGIQKATGRTEPANISFEEWAKKWLETYKHGKVKEHTYEFTYKSNIEKYIIPFFKNFKLIEIKQIDIQNYFNSLIYLSASTLKKHKLILNSIFEQAINNDYLYKNPMMDSKIKSTKKVKERPTWTLVERNIAVEWLKKDINNIPLLIILNSGIRRSEVCALQWEDIDFKNHTININKAIVPTTGKNVLDDTKTYASRRIIPISNEFCEYLQQHNGQGNVVKRTPGSFAKYFKKIIEKLNEETGVKIITPHEFRHTFATLLRENKVDIYTIQKVMGHSNISITAKYYIHNDLDVLRKSLKY